MLVILPVSRIDSDLAVKLSKWISTLGGGANHQLLVASTVQTKAVGDEILNTLRSTFSAVAQYTLDQEHEIGWPSSPNFMFKKTVGHIFARGNTQPFYWFEADNTPTKSTWLDDLQTEYNLAQKPFMGVIEPSMVYDPSTKQPVRQDGEHMNGSGIYPAGFVSWSRLFDTIHTHKEAQPWDLYLRWELQGRVHNSKQMLNNWKSVKYVRTADGPIASTAIDPNHQSKYVTDSIAVVHGCKDGSLIDLLESERSKPTRKQKS